MRSVAESFEVLQLLSRHRSRDIEHHGDFEALDLTVVATRHGKLSSRNRLLSLGDQRQLVDAGYLQKHSLDVRRAIRNHRDPVVADGEADCIADHRKTGCRILSVELLRGGDGGALIGGIRL